jgi:hypothetical protein
VRFEEAKAAADGEGGRRRWRQKRGKIFYQRRAEGETAPRIGRGLAGERWEGRLWLCAVWLERRGHNCDLFRLLSLTPVTASRLQWKLLQHDDTLQCRCVCGEDLPRLAAPAQQWS